MRQTMLRLTGLALVLAGLRSLPGCVPGGPGPRDGGTDLSMPADLSVPADLAMTPGDLLMTPADLRSADLSVSDLGRPPDLAPADLGPTGTPCDQWARATCAEIQKCSPVSFYPVYGDLTTCILRMQINCPARFSFPGTSDTPARTTACATALATTSCADYYSNRLPASCAAQPGTLADGAVCASDNQCKSAYCQGAGLTSCGKCAPRAAAGGACTDTPGCVPGTVCAAGTCKNSVGTGASCTSDVCDFGLYCGFNNKCVAYPGTRSPCGLGLYCDPARGGSCDAVRGCIYIQWSGVGGPCGVSMLGDHYQCVGGTSCPGPGYRMCIAYPWFSDGGACTSQHCLSPATCVAGTCTILDPSTCK